MKGYMKLSIIEKILEKLMYNRVYNFFTKNNLIYPLQFGFRQQYSPFPALISLTEDIRKNLYKGNTGCGISFSLKYQNKTYFIFLIISLSFLF